MENATKALLIAASVLIVLVLIGVGLKILSSTSGVTNQVGDVSTSMSASIFNSQFSSYFSSSTSGAQVKALIQKIIANNQNSSHIIAVTTTTGENSSQFTDVTNLSDFITTVSLTSKYSVTPTYTDGYISNIQISKNT